MKRKLTATLQHRNEVFEKYIHFRLFLTANRGNPEFAALKV